MLQHIVLKRICLLLLLHGLTRLADAQNCMGAQWIQNYTGTETQRFVKSLLAPSNNIVTIGNLQYLKEGIVHNDGWMSMLTKSGKPIFSKRFAVPGFDILQINDAVIASDSSYLLTGTIQTYWGVRDPAPPNPNWGILISVDHYGNIRWVKKMDQGFDALSESSFLQNIIQTNDGDFIANAVAWKKPPFSSKGMLLRIDQLGNLKWLTTYSSSVFEFRYNFVNQLLQTADGKKIITAGIIDERFKNKDSIVRVNHYMLSVDYASGQKNWDQSLNIRKQFSNVFTNYQTIRHITELGNGDFSFLGFGDTSFLSIPPITTRAINIISSAFGNIKKMIGYATAQSGLGIVDAVSLGNDHQILLLNNNTQSIATEIDAGGNLLSQKGFLSMNAGQQPTNLLITSAGWYLPMNGFGNQQNNYIYKTDEAGNIDCVVSNTNIQSADASSFLTQDDAQMTVMNDATTGIFSSASFSQTDYSLATSSLCNNSCCKDYLDTLHTSIKTVCEKDHYTLPNGVPISISGTYYITNKTTLGCDSISYFKITVLKDPSALSLGVDTCLEGRDSIQILATPGYNNYTWNTGNSIDNTISIKQAGNYQVTVNNQCGTKTAAINVLAICDAPIYIPNAFTPNADGLNEIFRIPPTAFYKLNSFQIYNRWGQLIFNTTDINKGWNGNYNGMQQPSGIYSYVISINSLKTGKTSKRTGSIQLIR